MRRLPKEVFIRHRDGRPVFPGFVTYIHAKEPTLMHRFGWEDYSDGFDDFSDIFSHDNGRTWTEPVIRLKSHTVEGGRIRYAENAGIFDQRTGRVLVFLSMGFYPNDRLNPDGQFEIMCDSYDPGTESWAGLTPLGLKLPGGVVFSSRFPL